jgi:hypothetical protein
MKPTFIITSAINASVGAYTPLLRIYQTHDTITSILKYYADATIVLVDGGKEITASDPIHEAWEALKARCHYNLSMSSNEQIKHLHTNFLDRVPNPNEMGGTTGLTKSVAELTLMAAVLDGIKNNDRLKDILNTDRIFKISGRYQLSPLFDPAVYESDLVKGKCVFRQRDASWMPDAQQSIGTGFGFASRLWSFDVSQLDDVIVRFNSMIEDCVTISATHYIDIEHLLFKHFISTEPVEIEHTHLMGTIAPTGAVVYD